MRIRIGSTLAAYVPTVAPWTAAGARLIRLDAGQPVPATHYDPGMARRPDPLRIYAARRAGLLTDKAPGNDR